MSTVTSLTAPADIQGGKFESQIGVPDLTNDETTEAMKALVNTTLVTKFKSVERRFADPTIELQKYTLFTFVPAKGATPDKDGVFGMAKVRGSYATDREAMERCDEIIRKHDSYHPIFIAHVGRPFPITLDSKYAEGVEEIDLKQKTVEVISEDIKDKRRKEAEEMKEIKEREKKLLEESKDDFVEAPLESYTTLMVKKAQLCWTYSETLKKMEQMKETIIRTRQQVKEMDEQNSDLKDQYYEHYMQARRSAGIPDEAAQENYMKFLVEDIDIGF